MVSAGSMAAQISQERWDQIGRDWLEKMRKTPEKFVVVNCPFGSRAVSRELVRMLGDLRGRRVLDLGCGFGGFSVWLAKRGAEVCAVDLGASLLEAARCLAAINGVTCDFRQANIVSLPFPDGGFDAVTGNAILHHLSERDVCTTVGECHRVLKQGGAAYFFEPVENSRFFNFLQNVIPVGDSCPRPSILMRRKWKRYLETLDDRTMSDFELNRAGRNFSKTEIRHYGLVSRLARLIGMRERLNSIDEWLLRNFPWLGRYSQSALVGYIK